MKKPSANVARFLQESAANSPNVCAVRLPHRHSRDGKIFYRELTFADLDATTAAAAEIFRARGISEGTRTLLMARQDWDLILAAFALFRLGAVPVAIDPGMGFKKWLSCIKKTRPTALVGIPLAVWARRLFRTTFSSVQTSITVGTKSFDRRLAATRENLVGARSEIAACKHDDLAAIVFTSGSTGAPKGVQYTHGMFDAQLKIIRDFYRISPGEVDLPLLPIFALFDPALGITTIAPEMNPAKPASLDPEKIVQAIKQNNVTNSFGSPTLWRKIAEFCDARGETLPQIHRILCAGTAVHPSLMALLKKILPNAEIHSPYGATENLPVSSISADTVLNETGALTARGYGTCTGSIVPPNRVRLVPISNEIFDTFDDACTPTDSSTVAGRRSPSSRPLSVFPLEQGQGTEEEPTETFLDFAVGEICVNGPTTTRAYDNDDAATQLAKIRDSDDNSLWHRMGDIGYFDDKGRLWFLGRKIERVQTPIGTLYTEACEPIFNSHPAVARCALIGLGQDPTSATPAIVLELRPNTPKSAHPKIISELRELAQNFDSTRDIKTFLIHPRKFPVDVRHNAKIHRLTLKKFYDKKLKNL